MIFYNFSLSREILINRSSDEPRKWQEWQSTNESVFGRARIGRNSVDSLGEQSEFCQNLWLEAANERCTSNASDLQQSNSYRFLLGCFRSTNSLAIRWCWQCAIFIIFIWILPFVCEMNELGLNWYLKRMYTVRCIATPADSTIDARKALNQTRANAIL